MKLNNVINITEDVLIVGGVAVGVAQIETILGIVLLSVQLLIILYKGISLIIKHVKNKDYNSAVDQAKDTINKIEETIDNSNVIKNNGEKQNSK